MSDTFLKFVDASMRVRVWQKFKDELGVSVMNTQSAFMTKTAAVRHISEKQGNMQLPFMSIWRARTSYDWDRNRTVLSVKGVSTGADVEGAIDEIKSVPVKVQYDFWVWSKDLDAVNSVMEKYMFWIHNDANLDLLFNDTYPLEFDLHFGDPIDESPIEEMYDKGLYFVMRFPITIDAWVFSSSFVRIIKKIYIRGLDYTIDADGEEMFSHNIIGNLIEDTATMTDSVDIT